MAGVANTAAINFELPDLGRCNVTRLRTAARRLTLLYDAALAPSGVKSSQFSIMAVVAKRAAAPPTIKDLARILGMDRSTMGQNLRPLERDGLLALAEDAADRRIRRVALTPAGRERLRQASALWAQAQARFEAGHGQHLSGELRELLRRIGGASSLEA